MGCKTIPEQVAEGLGKTTLDNSDQLPVVDNNTLYRVSIETLFNSAGFSGQLIDGAQGTATPLVTGSAPNYTIPGLIGGKGVSVSVDPQNNVLLQTQLENAGDMDGGEPIIVSSTSDTIKLRRLKSGNNVTINQDGDALVIAAADLNGSNPSASNTVLVSEISDFPEAVSGVITLAPDKDYLLVADISTNFRFVLSDNTVIRGNDPFTSQLTVTANGAVFTTLEGSCAVKNLTISAPNAELVDQNGTDGSFDLQNVVIPSITGIGDFSKLTNRIQNLAIGTITGVKGFSQLTSTNANLSVDGLSINELSNSAFVFCDIGTTVYRTFNLSGINIFDSSASQIFLRGASGVNSPNLATEAFGFVSRCNILGAMQKLQGIAYGDAGWEFTQCNAIQTTRPAALCSLVATAVTTVAAQNTPSPVMGSFTSQIADYFTITSGGRINYTAKRDAVLSIDATITLQPVLGTADLTVYFAINGVVEDASAVTSEVDDGAKGVVALNWIHTFSNLDYVEVFVENNSSANNIQIEKLVLRVG